MELQGICPWCGGNRFYFNTKKNVYVCFKASCGASGKGEPNNVTWLGVGAKTKAPEETRKELRGVLAATRLVPIKANSLAERKAHRYLLSHHIPVKVARSMGVRMDTHHLVFPLYDKHGKVSFYQQRGLYGKRFHNEGDKDRALYFTHRTPEKATSMALVESVPNAIRLARLLPAVAVFGQPTKYQLHLINLLGKGGRGSLSSLHVLLDADARKSSWKVFRYFQGRDAIPLVHLHLIPKGDVCDYDDKEIKKMLQSKTQNMPCL